MVPTAVGMGVAGKAAASAIGAKGLIGAVGPYAPFALVAAHIINSRLNRPKPRSVGPGGYLRAAEYMKEQGNTKDPYGQDWKIVTDPDTGTRYVQDPAAMKNYGQTIMASLDEGSLEKYRSDYAHTTRGQGIVQNLGYDMDKRHAHEQYINRGRHGLPSESQQRESGMPFDPGPPEGHDLSPSGRTADDIMAQGLKTGRGFDSKFGYANIDYGAA